MRWPWRHPEPNQRAPSSDADEAAQARQRAEEELRQAAEQTAEVREIAAKLRQHRAGNRFAELFLKSFEGGPR